MNAAYIYTIGHAYARIAEGNDAAALRLREGVVSHAQLNALSNRMASVLTARGLRRGDVLGIVHDKSALCYAAMLGALKIGVAYVNLDDQNPIPRMLQIFSSASPKVLAGQKLPAAIGEAATSNGITLIDFEAPQVRAEIAAAPSQERADVTLVTGSDPAYIMYTSGSTGVPKGAIITHAAVLNFAAWTRARFGIQTADVLSNVNPMYFDNSVFDFYAAMLNGASIVPISRADLEHPKVMLARLQDAGCTIWFSVPSLLMYLMTLKMLNENSLPAVRTFIFGGEGYPKKALHKLFALFGRRSQLVNVYGPTECTCISSAWDVTDADFDDDGGLVTLGPIAENFSMLVLGEGDLPVDPGGIGELCLIGPQVGLGYINDSERTERAFCKNPINGKWTERMYRTGDLVRLGADGRSLDFVGRADNQIKHMGYRVELEEIEAALNRIEGVLESAVVQAVVRREIKNIVAYVATTVAFTKDELRAKLGAVLPPYMIPQHFELRPSLPKNANGKLDRTRLAANASELPL